LADPIPEKIQISVNNGCLGWSEVEILNAVVNPPVVVARQLAAGCRNAVLFVPSNLLNTQTPTTLARIGPPPPTLPPNTNIGESKIILFCPEIQPPKQQLCVVKFPSGQKIKLGKEANYAEFGRPAWSADGTQIYYITWPSATSQGSLFVSAADGTEGAKQVNASDAAWSPDGQTIAYADNCTVLRLMRPDGTGRRFLNTPENPCIYWLRWSPDGSQIAYADVRDFGKKASSVWVINQDGTNPRRIYQFQILLWEFYGLAWSPDGKSVGIWYEVKETSGLQGLLLDATGNSTPQPIDWAIPIWWTPDFWPQWGITK